MKEYTVMQENKFDLDLFFCQAGDVLAQFNYHCDKRISFTAYQNNPPFKHEHLVAGLRIKALKHTHGELAKMYYHR